MDTALSESEFLSALSLGQAATFDATVETVQDESGATMAGDDSTDAKIAASEARGETRIARLEGKLDRVLDKIGEINQSYLLLRQDAAAERAETRREIADSRRSVINNSWVIAGVLALVVGVIATVIPMVFDLGMKNRETISQEVKQQLQQLLQNSSSKIQQ